MSFLRDRRVLFSAAFLVLALTGAYSLAGGPVTEDAALVTSVRRGPFVVTVTTSGELRAREAVNITGPPGAQQVEIYQMRISSIVPEGTVSLQRELTLHSAVATYTNPAVPGSPVRSIARLSLSAWPGVMPG